MLKSPYPYFGGKSRVMRYVWSRLGDVVNFIDPFAGSVCSLLLRPADHAAKVETVNDWNCVAPETRILRRDLTWAKAGDIRVGDQLIGFDEFNPGSAREGLRAPTAYRKFQKATVLAVRVIQKPRYRLTFDDGTEVVCSADHLWLGGSHVTGGRGWRWQKTESLVCNRQTQRSWVMKICDVVERECTWEAGWLGGFFDGEGHLVAGPGWQLGAAQKPGPILRKAESLLRERGFDVSIRKSTNCSNVIVNGGMRDTFRFLMQTRPERLIEKFSDKIERSSLYGRKKQAVGLIKKEFLGLGDVVAIQTDTSTYIAEGLASHNCYIANFWRAIQRDPAHVACYADSPVNEADLRARHRWLVGVSDEPPLIPSAWRDEPLRSAYLAGYRRDGLSNAAAFRARVMSDPDYYDAKFAGWWVWGQCCWIGGGWCEYGTQDDRRPQLHSVAALVGSPKETMPDLSGHRGAANGRGVLAAGHNQVPNLSGDAGATGRGIHAGGEAMKLNRGGHASMPGVLAAAGHWGKLNIGDHTAGLGVHKANQSRVPTVGKRPLISGRSHRDNGHGVHRVNNQNRPQLADAYSRGRGVHSNDALSTCEARRIWLEQWFAALSDRLRHVRVCCGDWLRVCDSPSVTTRLGLTGVWFDPPYRKRLKCGGKNRDAALYATDRGQDTDDLVDRVIAYCIERGGDPLMRIGVCCLEGEGYEVLAEHGWTVYAWRTQGGYGNRGDNANKDRERIWFSPHCKSERTLFD